MHEAIVIDGYSQCWFSCLVPQKKKNEIRRKMRRKNSQFVYALLFSSIPSNSFCAATYLMKSFCFERPSTSITFIWLVDTFSFVHCSQRLPPPATILYNGAAVHLFQRKHKTEELKLQVNDCCWPNRWVLYTPHRHSTTHACRWTEVQVQYERQQVPHTEHITVNCEQWHHYGHAFCIRSFQCQTLLLRMINDLVCVFFFSCFSRLDKFVPGEKKQKKKAKIGR